MMKDRPASDETSSSSNCIQSARFVLFHLFEDRHIVLTYDDDFDGRAMKRSREAGVLPCCYCDLHDDLSMTGVDVVTAGHTAAVTQQREICVIITDLDVMTRYLVEHLTSRRSRYGVIETPVLGTPFS